jgi:hypothetical protein
VTDITLSFKIDSQGNYYVDITYPHIDNIALQPTLAKYIAGLFLSVHSENTLSMTMDKMYKDCKKANTLHLYESILLEVTRARQVNDRPCVGPRDVFSIYKQGIIG